MEEHFWRRSYEQTHPLDIKKYYGVSENEINSVNTRKTLIYEIKINLNNPDCAKIGYQILK